MGLAGCDLDAIVSFCRTHNIVELAIFGSVAAGTQRPDSDIDVLVRFGKGASYDVDDFDAMVRELTSVFVRQVDLVPAHAVENPFIKRDIERTKRVLYAA